MLQPSRRRFLQEAGVVSAAATLAVDEPPTITTDPVSQAICLGNPVTFTASGGHSVTDLNLARNESVIFTLGNGYDPYQPYTFSTTDGSGVAPSMTATRDPERAAFVKTC